MKKARGGVTCNSWGARRRGGSSGGGSGLLRSHSLADALHRFLCSNFPFLSRGHDPYCQSSALAIEWPRGNLPGERQLRLQGSAGGGGGVRERGGRIRGVRWGWRYFCLPSPIQHCFSSLHFLAAVAQFVRHVVFKLNIRFVDVLPLCSIALALFHIPFSFHSHSRGWSFWGPHLINT